MSTRIFKIIILAVIVMTGCFPQKEGGRGYRYAHGGNYYGTAPSFSPDGTKIVFGSIRDGVGDIFTINIDGKDLRRLTNTEAYEGQPRFSPDGSQIVFISEREHASHGKIFTMTAAGSNQQQITTGSSYDYSPLISNDPSKIIFIRDAGNYYTDIFSITSDGTRLNRLTSDEIPKSFLWQSKDGKKIRYRAFALKTQEINIYEMEIDRSGRQHILTLPKGDGEATFSADGKQVVLISTRMTDYTKDTHTQAEVFIMNLDGTNRQQLTNTKTYKEHPTFSPDGKKIMFLSLEKDGRGKGQIMIMNTDGSDLKVIANNY